MVASCAARPRSRDLDPTIRNVANPPTTEEIIEDDFYGLRVVFDERLQRGRERRICRWSGGERIQSLPVTPRQAVRVERPFEGLIDETIFIGSPSMYMTLRKVSQLIYRAAPTNAPTPSAPHMRPRPEAPASSVPRTCRGSATSIGM